MDGPTGVKQLRILHLVHQYLPDYVGGTELYTRWLAAGLSRRGHQATIFYRRSEDGVELTSWADENGVRVWAASARAGHTSAPLFGYVWG